MHGCVFYSLQSVHFVKWAWASQSILRRAYAWFREARLGGVCHFRQAAPRISFPFIAFDLDDLQQCGGYMFGIRRDGCEHIRSPLRHVSDWGQHFWGIFRRSSEFSLRTYGRWHRLFVR